MANLRDWKPGLEHLKIQLEIYNRRRARFPSVDPNMLPLIGMVLVGWMERRPYNLSSIANDIGMSRPTATRGINELVRLGLIEIERHGQSRFLHPTQRLIDYTIVGLRGQVQEEYRRLAEVYQMMIDDPLPSS